MIDDPTLRELFRTESAEHLQHLDEALLRLEKAPRDKALLEEAFREAHSLKGAARMLGLDAVLTLAHQIEDVLNSARRGKQVLSAANFETTSKQLLELRQRVSAALAGEPAAGPVPERAQAAETTAAAIAVEPVDAGPNPLPEVPFRIESVRVEPRKLDVLMTLAGELTVTKTRAARRLAEIDALCEFCDEWRRAAPRHQRPVTQALVSTERLGHIETLLGHLRTGAAEDSARLDTIAGELESGIRQIRLMPLSNVFRLFPRMVHDLAREQGKEVELVIEGEETNADKRILEEIKDPLMHILRNAVDHGIEPPQAREQAGKPRPGRLCLKASQTPSSIVIEVGDDGRGLDEPAIRRAAAKRGIATEAALSAMTRAEVQALIFASGLSTTGFVTDVSGRGVGLDVVRNNVERLKGSVQIDSTPGAGMTIRIRLPLTLSTVRALIVEVNGHPYGLPAECVLSARMFAPADVYTVEGREAVSHQGRPVSVAKLCDLLQLPQARGPDSGRGAPGAAPCVLIAPGGETFGVFVDALLDEREVVLKPQSALLQGVRTVAGTTVLDSGEICMVLNPQDLLDSMRKRRAVAAAGEAEPELKSKKVILLAEDSIVTRTQEARILATAGYEVVTAVDGLDAYNLLATREFDAVVSDINMPNLDGLALTERIRREPKYAELPIILVTSLASDEDKQRGLEAGANAYITKPAFDEKILLDCLERMT
jgi:two-component system chemotaxis sensor kinase CheA